MTNKKDMSAKEIAGMIEASTELVIQTCDFKSHYMFTKALWDLAIETGIRAEVSDILQAKAMKEFDEAVENVLIPKDKP